MPSLLSGFQQFFRERSESWLERFDYKEAGPQLLLQAFLQRIVNGGGRIDWEYGLGRRRSDLVIIWPCDDGVQRVVIETKLQRGTRGQTMQQGLEQTWGYMDRCGVMEHVFGHAYNERDESQIGAMHPASAASKRAIGSGHYVLCTLPSFLGTPAPSSQPCINDC